MREREQETDPYWTDDVALGEGPIRGEAYSVRMRLHRADEPWAGREELFRLGQRKGIRPYLHAKPYLLQPEFELRVALHPQPQQSGEIGTVTQSEWTGMRHRDLGNAQAWFYPHDRTAVLWECFLEDWVRQDDPTLDELLATVWTGFERVVVEQFPDVQRVITPSWEDLYASRELWQYFLRQRGYQRVSQQAFLKAVGGR